MVKPVHPAAVHFPLAFLALSFGIDIFNTLSPKLPSQITSGLPASTDLSRASYALLCIALVTEIPAVVTGVRELVVIINKQGMYETKGNETTMREKVKLIIIHALFNYIVIGTSAYIWYSKRAAARATYADKIGMGSMAGGAAAYEPKTWMVGTEGFLFVLQMMAANIGGVLTYNFGVGFSAGGGSKKAQ